MSLLDYSRLLVVQEWRNLVPDPEDSTARAQLLLHDLLLARLHINVSRGCSRPFSPYPLCCSGITTVTTIVPNSKTVFDMSKRSMSVQHLSVVDMLQPSATIKDSYKYSCTCDCMDFGWMPWENPNHQSVVLFSAMRFSQRFTIRLA